MGEDIGKIFEKIKDIGKGFLLENIVKKLEDIHLSLIEMRREARFLERQDLIDEINEMERKVMLLRNMLEDERMSMKEEEREEKKVEKGKNKSKKR